ncbi:MAG: hypothetical protein KBT02_07050 [Treponema sp.]|nr:hypothetical protein [Candidatus Treponema caballi]
MTYKYDKKHSKNLLPMYLLAIACVGAGIACFFFASRLTALLVTAAGVYVAYIIFRTSAKILSSKVVTYSEGCTVYTTIGEKIQFDWTSINYSGVVTNGEHPGIVFMYREDEDKIATIPNMFQGFDELVAEIKENTPFKEYTLADDEPNIIAHLKKLVCPPEEDDEEAESNETADSSEN